MVAKFMWHPVFVRQPRTLHELDNWKATELRQFILYLGSVLLKDILPQDYYSHFMLFFISINIMSVEGYFHNIDIAKDCLSQFVKNYTGKNFLAIIPIPCYIHLLVLKNWVPCQLLRSPKKILKKTNAPPQQVVKRLAEKDQFLSSTVNVSKTEGFSPLKQNHYEDLLRAGIDVTSYSGMNCEKYKLTTKAKDNVLLRVLFWSSGFGNFQSFQSM